MRIVAIRAGNFAGRDGMRREVMNLRALRLVARKADLSLRLLCQCLVLRNMDLVA